MCDKKNSVLFTDTECLVLSSDFKLPDASQVLLRVTRENNMYNVNLKNIIPSGDLTCLFAKATLDESNLWHRRLGHVNFKTINKLVKGNLVRGLPSKVFTNDNSCVACKKGKQHRASCKSKTVSSVDQPLLRLHMDLFGPTFVKSLSKKSYCLVITDDYSRFSWVFFLPSKDETPTVLKTFIIGLENLLSLKTLSWRNKIGMHTLKDDYLINTLKLVSRKEASQKYGVVLPECLTSPQIKESKAYKTYLGYATGTVPPKVARKFKKVSPSKKDSVPVPIDEEPVQEGKRVKRSAKKSSTTPTIGIVMREPHVETQSKRKEEVDVARGKGIDLLSEITPPVTSKGTGDKPRVLDVTKDESTESESKSLGNDEDDSNNKEGSEQENDSEEYESNSEQDTNGSKSDSESDQQVNDDDEDDDNDKDKSEDDEDRGIDSDDIQDKKADVGMTDAQQEKENLKIAQEQVVEDAHVTITMKTEVHVTIFSRSSDLASKFLNFSYILPADTEIVSPLDVHVHHEVPRIHTSTLLVVPVSVIPEASPVYTNIPQPSQTFNSLPLQVIALEKDVVELKNDPIHTQVTALVDDYLDTRMGATREEYINFLSASLTDKITKQAAATLTEFELKKILIDKMNSSESYLTAPENQECYDGLIKSYNLDKDFFSSYDVYSLKRSRDDRDKDEGPSDGLDRRNQSLRLEILIRLKVKKGIMENPKGGDYPFDLSKPLSLITRGNRQSVPVEFFINNDLKYLQGGISTMTYTTSTTKTKVAHYNLPGIKDMRKTFYAYARGIQSRGDVYSTKRILAVTNVLVMRKHGYGYLEEIIVRRADNALYKFKEGDFP
nr:putative ribonuclease H-like domain-containing protein [Tanacetum cinerariifolium]